MRTLETYREREDETHGGRLKQARLQFPNAPEPFIDLSTGINPHHYPLPALSPSAWTRLPEPEDLAGLEATAAAAYGASAPDMAAAVPGTQLLISLLPSILPDGAVAVLSPTYNEYARAFAGAGRPIVEAHDLADLAQAPHAILCNPNNPDGRRFADTELLALLASRRDGGLLVVDESFVDLEGDGLSVVPHLPRPGLLVLRSLSKGYGFGGLRLGFALGAPTLAASIRSRLGPWRVSGPAVEIGAKALSDRDWRNAIKRRLAEDVARLDVLLTESGLILLGGTALFRLVASEKASALHDRLGQHGILVRAFPRYPDWLRFGIPATEAEWERLSAALS
jgi:cobalamin biosynthetic protein CobC